MSPAGSLLEATYNPQLVVLSVLTAMIASYVALDLAGRVAVARGRAKFGWWLGGAGVMGMGIWSMHFIGMLAFSLPIPVNYHVPLVILSLGAALGGAGLALPMVSRSAIDAGDVLTGGFLMGVGMVAMHYIGMAAMELSAVSVYDPFGVALSILVACGVSMLGFWLSFRLRMGPNAPQAFIRKTIGAIVMGSAIPSMHYTAMAAVAFAPVPQAMEVSSFSVDISLLGGIAMTTWPFLLLGLTLGLSFLDRQLSAQAVTLLQKNTELTEEMQKRARVEQALRQTQDELEVRIKARTSELSNVNARLRQEVREHKHAQEEIASLAKFPAQNPNPVFRVSQDGTILYANQASTPLLNVWNCQIGESLSEPWRLHAETAFQYGQIYQTEDEIGARTYSLEITPIPADGYANIYAVDVTEQKVFEEEKKRIRDKTIQYQTTLLNLVRKTFETKEDAFAEVTRVMADTLEVERASIWLLDADQRNMICMDAYISSHTQHEQGTVLSVDRYPRYCAAIKENFTIAARDARTDPRTAEFREDYLDVLGITSKMACPVFQQGTSIGALCFEHVGPSREWTPAEQQFGGFVADFVAYLLESFERRHIREENTKIAGRLQERVRELTRMEATLGERLRFENLTVSISTKFINLPISEIDDRVTEALQTIGGFVGVERAYIFLLCEETDTWSATHEWHADGYGPFIEHFQEIPADSVPWILQQLRQLNPLPFSQISDLPPEAGVEKALYRKIDPVQSSILIPLACRGELIGVFGLNSMKERCWAKDVVDLLRILGEIFANAFERRAAEEALHQARMQLEQRVQERTAELAESNRRLKEEIVQREQSEKALQQAKEIAESANRAKSEFLTNMSHELRTPLNGILGYAQILKGHSTLSQEQRSGLDVIHRSGEHLLTLLNDILDLSKIERHKLELLPTSFHLPSFLSTIVGIIKVRANEAGLAFYHEFPDSLPQEVEGDKTRLRQVLLNLLSNAVKFTRSGQVSFIVTADETAGVPHAWRFQIEDTGIGIAFQHLENIFLPFHQVSDTQQHIEGTGLGLAITNTLVTLMGGTMQVESQEGKGSRFWFTISLPSVSHVLPRTENQHRIIGVKTSPKRVLVVDDKWENRAVLGGLLKSKGFTIDEASNGQAGLAMAQRHCPDIIFMDLVMPGMDGFSAVKALQAMPECQHAVIIALSASAFDFTRQKSLKAGCHGFLSKPIQETELVEVLETHAGIEWEYERTTEQEDLPPDENESMPAPPVEFLQPLYELAKRGQILDVRKQIERIEQLDPQYATFTKKLREFGRKFNLKQLIKFLSSYLGEKV